MILPVTCLCTSKSSRVQYRWCIDWVNIFKYYFFPSKHSLWWLYHQPPMDILRRPIPTLANEGKHKINKIKLSIKTSKWRPTIIKYLPHCYIINPYVNEQVPDSKILHHFILCDPFIEHRYGCILYFDASENNKCYWPKVEFKISKVKLTRFVQTKWKGNWHEAGAVL